MSENFWWIMFAIGLALFITAFYASAIIAYKAACGDYDKKDKPKKEKPNE